MPSEIFKIAKIYEEDIFSEFTEVLKAQTSVFSTLLSRTPEPTDDEIIRTIRSIKDQLQSEKSLLHFSSEKFIRYCEKFIARAYRQKANEYKEKNWQNSPFYRMTHVPLLNIFKYLNKHQLAITARTTPQFASFIRENNLIEKTPFSLRDYREKPSVSRVITDEFESFHILHFIDHKMQLMYGNLEFAHVYDVHEHTRLRIGSTNNLLSLLIYRCFASLTDKLAIRAGERKNIFSSSSGVIQIWKTDTWECIQTIDVKKPVSRLVVFPENKMVIISSTVENVDDEIQIWDTKEWVCLTTQTFIRQSCQPKVTIKHIAVSTTDLFYITNYGYSAITVNDWKDVDRTIDASKLNHGLIHTSCITFLDKNRVITCRGSKIKIDNLYNFPNKSVTLNIPSKSPVTALAAIDNNRFVSGSNDGIIVLWENIGNDQWVSKYLEKGNGPIKYLAIQHASGKIICIDKGLSILIFPSLEPQSSLNAQLISEDIDEAKKNNGKNEEGECQEDESKSLQP